MDVQILKVFIPMTLTFAVGMAITPYFTDFFFKHKLWKRAPRKLGAEHILDTTGKMHKDAVSLEFQKVTNADEEMRTPRIGGIIIWTSLCIATTILGIIAFVSPTPIAKELDFISRNQTLLPFIALVLGGIVGLIDDLLVIQAQEGIFKHGFPRRYMLTIVGILGTIFSLWFYFKLGVTDLAIPFTDARLELGIFMIPFFIFIVMGTFSSGVIDGIDGLAGGVMATIFSALGVIAYFNNQLDIATLCAATVGILLVFLWFNVPPARFYLGETGMLALTMMLSVIVFLTDTVLLLPILGLPLVLTSLSSLIQITYKKIYGPTAWRPFKVAPLHHHFEATGWSRPKITMRYWIISVMCAVVGIIVALV